MVNYNIWKPPPRGLFVLTKLRCVQKLDRSFWFCYKENRNLKIDIEGQELGRKE